MSNGEMFLLDEISLADDAVLERLNSLLEPERRIHLTERSELTDSKNTLAGNDLVAHPQFRFVATMNPGGDYGKKELSPALRNRFTEIWCLAPTLTGPAEETQSNTNNTLTDLIAIVRHNLFISVLPKIENIPRAVLDQLATVMVEFVRWYALKQVQSQSTSVGLTNRRYASVDVYTSISFLALISLSVLLRCTNNYVLLPTLVILTFSSFSF